ncbi:hypothetical protein SAMN05216429_11223 [Marinobacter persicus]|uniref:Uncharacterized protein n=2 Tax=Marinobacter persicus TaxID=930118 RepID=A0A1I3XLJ8_9GAMM|nr:hypothetical protein SAMN05216429_11223 [Marinobacter persicus]
MRTLISESKMLKKSAFELHRRRLNWRLVAKNEIAKCFRDACDSATKLSYPFSMYCNVHDDTKNEETVQLSSGVNHTGIVEKIDKPDEKGWKAETEKGAALVASFGSNGTVAFIIYPYKSDRHSRNEDNIILYHNLSPDAVTDELIKRCIGKFLLYVRNSSIYGGYSLSFFDRMHINMMILIDIRNRKQLYRNAFGLVAEWSKIIGAGIAGYIVAILTQGS